LNARTIAPSNLEDRRRIELAKGFCRHVDAGNDEIGLRDDRAARAMPSAIVAALVASPLPRSSRAPGDQIAIRLGLAGLHTLAPAAGFSVISTAGSAPDLKINASARDAAFRSRSTS
jgi:hypothetical protein